MRLDDSTTYVVLSTNPANPRGMKIGDVVGIHLCEPGGPDFRVSVRLSRLDDNGSFQGMTLALQQGQGQLVGGSFTNPHPDMNTRR